MQDRVYFVTGANGFVGAALARELVARSYRVTLMVHQRRDHPFLRDLPATVVQGDLSDGPALSRLIPAGAHVIHCAARVSFAPADHSSIWETNFHGTRRLLDAAIDARAKSVLFVSAGAIWGSSNSSSELINENSPLGFNPQDAYAASKAKAEDACRSACERGLDVKIANPVTTYGAGDQDLRAAGRVVHEVLSRRHLLVPPGGTSWIHIDDLVRGILLALERGKTGARYILSAGNVSYADLFDVIIAAGDWRGRKFELPSSIAPVAVHGFEIAGVLGRWAGLRLPVSRFSDLFRYKYFDATRARCELGFEPVKSLEASVRSTVEHIRQNKLSMRP